MLHHVPELATASAERRTNIARWAAHLYPSDPSWPIHLKPDMLTEWFAVTQLTQTPELADLLRLMTPPQEVALLVLLAHASDQMSEAVQLFADVVAADIPRLAEAGVAAAQTASTGRRGLDGALANLINEVSWSADALGPVENQLTDRLPRTRAAVGEARVQIARRDDNAATLAMALTDFVVRLVGLGRNQEALTAAEEAVGLYRPLARDNPAHQPDLARALNYLGNCLGGLGRDSEALAVTEQAVGLYQQFARDNLAYQPDLARALINLGIRLDRMGRDSEALAVTEQVRRLVPATRPRQPRLPARPRRDAG